MYISYDNMVYIEVIADIWEHKGPRAMTGSQQATSLSKSLYLEVKRKVNASEMSDCLSDDV